MTAPVKINLVVNQRSSFVAGFIVNDQDDKAIDLADYTIQAKLKKDHTSPSTVSFATTAIVPTTNGKLEISLTPEQTAPLSGSFVYDVAIIKSTSGFKTRIVEGNIRIDPGVT
jgi:hypothetical protein